MKRQRIFEARGFNSGYHPTIKVVITADSSGERSPDSDALRTLSLIAKAVHRILGENFDPLYITCDGYDGDKTQETR